MHLPHLLVWWLPMTYPGSRHGLDALRWFLMLRRWLDRWDEVAGCAAADDSDATERLCAVCACMHDFSDCLIAFCCVLFLSGMKRYD